MARNGRVYASGNDGSVRVYAQRGPNRYVLLHTWSVSVPGLPGTQPLSELQVLPGGYLAGTFLWLSADLSQTVGGVAVLDRSGALVAVWEPTEQVDEGWGVVPISLSQPTPGTLLTTAVQCSAGGCSLGKLFGYAYALQLARSPGGGVSLEQTGRWRSRELVAISSASALDLSHLIAFDGFSTGGATTNEVTLSGERVLVGAELSADIVGDIDALPTRASRQQAVWLLADADDVTVLQHYVRTDAGWERTKELLAKWGREGPPDP